jgi:uncharacterized coiled-coil protein SlyX
MKKESIITLVFISITIFLSCSSNIEKDETPEALEDKSIDIKTYSRYRADLIEELYAELAEKNPSLTKLEENLDEYYKKLEKIYSEFREMDNKSNEYYTTANSKLQNFNDSVFSKKIGLIIEKSKKNYMLKKSAISKLIDENKTKQKQLDDSYLAMKILITMPLIEEYQDKNIPEEKSFIELNETQKEILKEINSLIKN